jgi:nicotinate-nucleotide adenylyltransferase
MGAVKVGFFGGSFDPVHVSHVLLVDYVLSTSDLDQVVVVPVYDHAFAKSLSPFEHRVAMAELAFQDLRRVTVLPIERELETPNFTLATLKALLARHPDYELSLIVGGDVMAVRHKWQAFDEIEKLAPPLVIGRRGSPSDEAPKPLLPEVSSSEIRALLGRPKSPSREAELRQLVPRRVLDYIDTHRLYGENGDASS